VIWNSIYPAHTSLAPSFLPKSARTHFFRIACSWDYQTSMKSKNRIGKAKWDAEKEFFIFSENFQKQHKVKKAELSWWIRGKLAANPDQLIVEHFYISYFV